MPTATSTSTQPGSQFIIGVSKQTGIDPRVLLAWMVKEGAYTKGGTGGYNYLNLRPFPGDKHAGISPKGFAQYLTVQDAINATVTNLHSPQYASVLSTARLKPPPRQEIAVIAASPWDANHYGGPGGPDLLDTFSSLFGKTGGSSAYQPPSVAPAMLATVGTGSASTSIWDNIKTVIDDINAAPNMAIGGAVDVGKQVVKPITAVGDAIGWAFDNWDRIFLVIGGAVALLVAILLIYKSQSGGNTFTFQRGE